MTWSSWGGSWGAPEGTGGSSVIIDGFELEIEMSEFEVEVQTAEFEVEVDDVFDVEIEDENFTMEMD